MFCLFESVCGTAFKVAELQGRAAARRTNIVEPEGLGVGDGRRNMACRPQEARAEGLCWAACECTVLVLIGSGFVGVYEGTVGRVIC